MKIYDISISLDDKTIIYPNNPELVIEDFSKIPESSSRLSKITIGSHTGTHLDAPSHAILDGIDLDKIPLSNFIGLCKVYDFSYLKPGECIKISDFENAGEAFQIKSGYRILVKTSNSERGYNEFYDDFVYLDGDAAEWLAEKGIALFGIDYLSIKQKGSKDNRPHTALLSKNIPVLEGINLKEVPKGEYNLFCPPIKFVGIDGSPTRAILTDN